MSLLHYAGRLYSLDTLDSRFTSSSKSPATRSDPATASPDDVRRSRDGLGTLARSATPPRWRSPEFLYHGLVFLVIVPWMFKTVYDISQPSHPEWAKYEPLLSPGWIPGRLVDNSDSQYSNFRDNLPYLFIVVALHPLLRRGFNAISPLSSRSAENFQKEAANGRVSPRMSDLRGANDRLNQRISFDMIFGLLFLIALHGFSAAKVLLILWLNYVLATQTKKDYVPVATWVFNIAVLFANELGQGYPYETIANSILPWATQAHSSSTVNWGSFLDNYGGLIPRWEILFKITVLRLISFNFDYCWSLDRAGGSSIEKKQLDPANLSERERVDISAAPQDYSFRNYLAYTLYSPLYLAGPILTFNDFISQQRFTLRSINWSRTIRYGTRLLLALLAMEVMIHFVYVVAISKAQPAWEVYSPFQVSMLGYFNLHHIWLKLLLPWRFFRLWALIDGIDPPENMVRCMSDNYSSLAFWRGWHRSFNRWIVRYIYIPLGGNGGPGTHKPWGRLRPIFNTFIIFSFVAIWHDIQLKLLAWGWLITLFVLPEIVAGYLFPKQKWQNHKEAYRVLCGIGAVGNILMMMAANLVGFALGLDGLKGLVQAIAGSYSGLVFLMGACATLFTGVQVMFELRQQELRQGINITC